jgi:spore coat protein JC
LCFTKRRGRSKYSITHNNLNAEYGGPDGEISASLRYLSQRYAMPYPELKAILTDIGTEELAHLEMVATIVHQLTRNLTEKQLKEGNFGAYFVNHTNGIYPCDATGVPFSACSLQVKGDPITDIHEDMAAEQKARSTYDNILRMTDDPDVRNAIRFLREREVVHYQRFGEGLRIITDHLDDRNFYAFNPAFDKVKTRAVSASVEEPAAEPVSAPVPESLVSTMEEDPIVSVGTSPVFNENVV